MNTSVDVMYDAKSKSMVFLDREDGSELARIDVSEGSEVMARAERLTAAAPEMYELLKVWTEIQAQPMLREARDKARELIARIDGEAVRA